MKVNLITYKVTIDDYYCTLYYLQQEFRRKTRLLVYCYYSRKQGDNTVLQSKLLENRKSTYHQLLKVKLSVALKTHLGGWLQWIIITNKQLKMAGERCVECEIVASWYKQITPV